MPSFRACRSCGYRLVERTEPRCPECGRRFDPEDPQTFGVSLSRPEVVGRFELEWIGEALRAELFGHGILSSIETSLGGVAGYAPRLQVRVFVDADDLERALAAMGEAQRRADGAWSCPQCDELVPGGFDLCWSCATPRESSVSDAPREGERGDSRGTLAAGDHRETPRRSRGGWARGVSGMTLLLLVPAAGAVLLAQDGRPPSGVRSILWWGCGGVLAGLLVAMVVNVALRRRRRSSGDGPR